MGHGPSLQAAVDASEAAKAAVNAAVARAELALANTEDKAKAYLDANTKGIVEVEFSNNKSYSKYADEYSLDALTKVIDDTVKVAQDYLEPGEDPTKASQMAGDVGSVVKSLLSLAATSSSTSQNLQVVFNHILADETNYAMYYACNSMTVDAENAWGSKDIVVVTNMYIFAEVEPDPGVTYAKILQRDLETLQTLNDQYDDAIIAATNQQELDALNFNQEKIDTEMAKIQKELGNIGAA